MEEVASSDDGGNNHGSGSALETDSAASYTTGSSCATSSGSAGKVMPGKRKKRKSKGKVGRIQKEHRHREKRTRAGENSPGSDLVVPESTVAVPGTSASTLEKRPYNKRKGLLMMPKKKRSKKEKNVNSASSTDGGEKSTDGGEKSTDGDEKSTDGGENLTDSGSLGQEANDADNESSSGSTAESRRKYKKQKFSLGRLKKASKRVEVLDDEGDELVEVGDGDDHAEYEYIHSAVVSGSDEIHMSPPVDLHISNFETASEAVEFLASDLSKSMADSNYIVDVSENSLRFSLLGPTANVYVVKAVTWSQEMGTRVFVHNQRVPSNSIVYLPEEDSNSTSIPALSDYLIRVATMLNMANVCEGIKDYQEFWSGDVYLGKGTIEREYFEGADCFRSTGCQLAIFGSEICGSCKLHKERFRKREWKKNQSILKSKIEPKSKPSYLVNHTFMSRKDLEKKLEDRKKESKAQAQKIRRLRQRIAKQIKKESFPVDNILGQDFFKILKGNVNKMTDIQKLFWSEQVKALSRQKNPRSMKWSPMMIKIALHLQMLSPAALNYWKEAGLIYLPSERRLYDFTHFTKAKEGIQEYVLESVKKDLDPTQNPQEHFTLLFDEMTIRSDIVFRKGEILGCTNMTSIETSVATLQSELNEEQFQKDPAKKVLVYMLQGITTDVQEIVAIFATTDLTAQQLYTRTWDVVYNCEANDLKILSLVCDGAGCNKKFFRMNVPWDPTSKFSYATKNIACGENRPLFFIVDPPHLLKTIRNCFSNSHAHKFSRQMWKGGHAISWEAIERLHDISIGDKFVNHKLTRGHVKLTAFSRMNVKLATQVMSGSVAANLNTIKDDSRFHGLINSPLIEFIETVNTLFDCLNGSFDEGGKRIKRNPNLLPYVSATDVRLTSTLKKCLAFFDYWYEDVYNREGNFTKDQREKMMISSESYESLHITVQGFIGGILYLLSQGVKSVDAKSFNQDKLEQFFGLLRMSGGASNNPNLVTVLQKCISLSVQKTAALPSRKGNTAGKRQPLQISQAPLPSRKK